MYKPEPGEPGHYIDVNGHKIFGYSRYVEFYKHLVLQAQDGAIFVEIGSFLGQSTAALAHFVKESKKAVKIYAVDIFDISEFSDSPHAKVVDAFGGNMLDAFWENIVKAGVDGDITAIQKDSVSAASEFEDRSVSYLMIDASHKYADVVEDIETWFPKVKIGGIIVGDDYDWHEVKEAANDTLGKVLNNDSTWYIQKVAETLKEQKTIAKQFDA